MKACFAYTHWVYKHRFSISVIFLVFTFYAKADIADLDLSNDLEIAAAIANQQAYQDLLNAGCIDDLRVESEACSGSVFDLFTNMRELVHTANALLLNNGPTQFSLDLDVEGLGEALRWTAGEEFASQGNLTDEFVGGQLANLSSRLKALRSGASGFGFTNVSYDDSTEIASLGGSGRLSGGAASADQTGGFSRWGGFINSDFGYGSKNPTVFEDAYDFEGSKITFGADYRYDDKWVFGLIGGIIDQEIDFNSLLSIVDGGIETDGYSVMPYFLYQTDNFYGSFSVGWQKQGIDMERYIKYPSLNPNFSGVNTITTSSTDATATSLFAELGYSFRHQAFILEPFVSISRTSTKIDSFSEKDITDAAFDLRVGSQNFNSLETSIGVKLQYAYTPSWGVIIPYFDIQSHSQQENDSRNISTTFSNLPSGSLTAPDFNLPTDELDSSYYSYSIGMSFVFQGAVFVDADGNSSGSMQGFVNYKSIENVDNYKEKIITLGFRYGF